jgi:hypothetical protein
LLKFGIVGVRGFGGVDNLSERVGAGQAEDGQGQHSLHHQHRDDHLSPPFKCH